MVLIPHERSKIKIVFPDDCILKTNMHICKHRSRRSLVFRFDYLKLYIQNIRCGMIFSEIALHKRSNATEIYNCRSPNDLPE